MNGAMSDLYREDNPSPRFHELIAAYRQLHEQGSPEHGIAAASMFPGQSLGEHLVALLEVTGKYGVRTMLDYGCGKAMLYQPVNDMRLGDRKASCVQELLGVDATLFDPGFRPYAEKPGGRFDLVVSTDVLEHCSEADLPWIIDELFAYARKYVFANVACYPARKLLPNGENAHCTIRDTRWWDDLFSGIAARYPGVDYQVVCTRIVTGGREHDYLSRV